MRQEYSGARTVLAGFRSATRTRFPIGTTRASGLIEQETTRSRHLLTFGRLPTQLVVSDEPTRFLDDPEEQLEAASLPLGSIASNGGLEGRKVHVVMFLTMFPAGLAGRVTFDAGMQTVGPSPIRNRMGSNFDVEALTGARIPGTRTWTALLHAIADLDGLPLRDLLSDSGIHLGRTPGATLESLRPHGTRGRTDLDRATAGDQDEDRNGNRQAEVHGVDI